MQKKWSKTTRKKRAYTIISVRIIEGLVETIIEYDDDKSRYARYRLKSIGGI